MKRFSARQTTKILNSTDANLHPRLWSNYDYEPSRVAMKNKQKRNIFTKLSFLSVRTERLPRETRRLIPD